MPKFYETKNEQCSSIQASYLEKLKAAQLVVNIYLFNGIKLRGKIADFDDTVILLKSAELNEEANLQIVYRHAISTTSPHLTSDEMVEVKEYLNVP